MKRLPRFELAAAAWLMACLGSGCSSEAPAPTSAPAPNDPNALFNTSAAPGSPASGPCVPAPGNFEVPGNGCDDDANGQIDDVAACDQNLPLDGTAAHFARALGICQMADAKHWGLVSAAFTGSYGAAYPPNPMQHGILPKFGSTLRPRQGAALGVLSSGVAREFNAGSGLFKQGQFMSGPGRAPPGFPKPALGCPIDSNVFDVVSLKLVIRTPANAKGVTFDFDFASGEWPEWVCTRYNDGFVAMVTSKALGAPVNISYDAQNNPVSVNNGFFDRCTPGTTTGCSGEPPIYKVSACAGGESELAGTGFEPRNLYCGNRPSTGGGATGWLSSQAPVQPGEDLTIEFLVWDTGDDDYDSSVLLDNLRWEAGPTQTQTQRPK
jgi:hypothetical protein